MKKNADKGCNNIIEPRQFCNTRSHRSESYLGGIGQGPFQNSLSQIRLWANSFEVTGVTQGINLALRLRTLAEIWLAILLAVLEVYLFSVVSSEELPRQPIAFPLWAALVFPTLSSHLFLNCCINSWTDYFFLTITSYENISFFVLNVSLQLYLVIWIEFLTCQSWARPWFTERS